ncbi:MAG TPA: hydantoinase/oxoprolinase family protein [Novimethylophilus sp.]|jgi:probable H4MPT-linked C1 transfer pathway protein|uniref:hydantoinase/oxoprolinase family protein n=1 Tax=Novimethylophilus sp. TaxID=2137426 RepID=UPI002F3FAA1B
MADSIGWDLGGAHLKAVRLDEAGRVINAVQLPCPLWQGLTYLGQAIDAAVASLGDCRVHAVTMTGELADIFPDRRQGVTQLVETMQRRLPVAELKIFAGMCGFVEVGQAQQRAADIASANWLASAQYAASRCGNGLFVDIGSTTTDLVPLHEGVAQPRGFSDAERLTSEELVYTGVIRTPVMAVAQRVPFGGHWQRLAAEHFATMADVHRLTGNLDPAHDMAATADGAGKSLDESARRLARMVGRDIDDAPMDQWFGLARFLADVQLRDIGCAVEHAWSRRLGNDAAPLIGAGVGRFMLRELARRTNRPFTDFSDLVEGTGDGKAWAAVCAPAFAVAWLARKQA